MTPFNPMIADPQITSEVKSRLVPLGLDAKDDVTK